jgi:hypothetical protein
MSFKGFFPVLLVVVALTSVLVGCSSDRMRTAPVKGKVMYKGKPVPNGTITFNPASGPTATGEIQADGTFVLTTYRKADGAIPGKHTVVIVAMQDMTNKLPEERTPLPPPIVPDKYTSAATTNLKVEVKDAPNNFDFDLKD